VVVGLVVAAGLVGGLVGEIVVVATLGGVAAGGVGASAAG
jgi:hypothetical protein